jgi:hypothetical protein
MKSFRRFYKWRRKKFVAPKSNALSWLRSHAALICLLLLIILFTYREFRNYYSRISYQFSETLSDTNSNEQDSWIRFTISTQKAFLPFEKIRIDVVYFPSSSSYFELVKTSKSMGILFENSEFTKNEINQGQITTYDKNLPKERQVSAQFPFTTSPPGSIKLRNRPTSSGIFSGSAEIIYTNKGEYPIVLIFADGDLTANDYNWSPNYIKKQIFLKTKISIDSYTEANTAKNNQLLYILTVVNILLVLYSEFFRKK